ncbi:hypothetical protein Nmel_000212, partial [Mimus melanotis]
QGELRGGDRNGKVSSYLPPPPLPPGHSIHRQEPFCARLVFRGTALGGEEGVKMSLGRRPCGPGLGPGVSPGALSGGRGARPGPGIRLPGHPGIRGASGARCNANIPCCCQCLLSPSGVRSHGHKLKHKKFHLSMGKNGVVLSVEEHRNRLPGKGVESPFCGDIENPLVCSRPSKLEVQSILYSGLYK